MGMSGSPRISIIPTTLAGSFEIDHASVFFLHQSSHFDILNGFFYRPLLEPLESLLQMLLLWDPVARGGMLDTDTNKPHCYTALRNILNTKVNLAFFSDTGDPIAYILALQKIWEVYTIIASNVNEGPAATIVDTFTVNIT